MNVIERSAVCVDCPWSAGDILGNHAVRSSAYLHIHQTGHTVSILSNTWIDDEPFGGWRVEMPFDNGRPETAPMPYGADPGDVSAPSERLVVDQRTGPRTIVGPGEYCLLCDDPMDTGAVYLFAHDAHGGHGIVHEACLEEMHGQKLGKARR